MLEGEIEITVDATGWIRVWTKLMDGGGTEIEADSYGETMEEALGGLPASLLTAMKEAQGE